MSVHRVLSEQAVDPPALHIHAMNDLRFIRQTMERSASFTAVPGWGMVGVGSTAWVTAWVASHFADSYLWLIFWLAEAFAAFLIGTVAMTYKAHSVNVSLLSGAGGRFMMNLFVPIFTGIPLTLILFQHDEIALLPSLWLLLYGIGVVTGGAFAVRTVRIMGFGFILTGMVSLFLPPVWGNTVLAFGFGGLHILFGGIIAWRHGG